MTRSRLAWLLWGVSVALAVTALVFLALNGSTTHANGVGEPAIDALFGLVYLTFPTVGLLIALRLPGNAIGWLLLAGGVGAQLEDSLLGYATYALLKDPGSLPGGAYVAVVADLIWLPSLALGLSLLLLLFPTGRPPSPRWRLLIWAIGATVAVYVVGTTLNPAPLYYFPSTRNPLGIEGTEGVLQPIVDVTGGPFILSAAAAAVALVLRFRRAGGLERQQLRWLVYAGALITACIPVLVTLGELEVRVAGVLVTDALFALLVATIPLAVGIAILRHRLYDIDVVVNRALVYGALTATLLAAYLGSVLLLQLLLSPGSDLAVAGSTLAVAALFRPARGRIQAEVDRRFYRRRYDAARTLEGFGARVRNEVALDSLSSELRAVVAETMQPAHVSLWLRGAAR